ncbi:MAG: carbohydrate-binding protein [Verrucomicrobiota bacterium]|jgi:hypothetical protein|nr:carbohydrate-binding protein [Verrucomicrobiota bacterium]
MKPSRPVFIFLALIWILGAGMASAALVPALTGLSAGGSFGTVKSSASIQLNNTMTLEAWIYPTAWRSYSGREKHGLNFIYKGRIGSHIDYVFTLQENGILCLGNTRGYIGVHTHRVPLNKWTHVAVSVNESTGSVVFYINGVNVGGGTGWQGASVSRTSLLEPSGNDLYIGGFYQWGWGYNNDNFIGKVADVRLWNVVRTPEQIAGHYQQQLKGTESGLVGYYTFEDLKDRSGRNNHLTSVGTAALTAAAGPDLQKAGGIEVAFVQPTNYFVGNRDAYIPLQVTAVASSGVSRVDYYVAQSLVATSTSAPFSATWSSPPPGTHTITAVATNHHGQGGSAEVIVRVPGPYANSPATIPGYISAIKFDEGGQGFGYSDTTTANEGGVYRPRDGVGIAADAGAMDGYSVGWTAAGEWLQYTVHVLTGGTYEVKARVAAAGSGGQFRIWVDNANKGTANVPNTGSWTKYAWVSLGNVSFAQGISTMRVEMVKIGSGGNVAAFDCFLLGETPPPVQSPYTGLPMGMPGLIEAEYFDLGGEGLGYHDTETQNQGGAFRPDEAVDISKDGSCSGYTTGWTAPGEWLAYTINVQTAGVYDIVTRVAGKGSAGRFSISVDGVDKTGNLAVPNTGNWTAYQTVTAENIHFTIGVHTMRVHMVTLCADGSVGAFDWFRLDLARPDQLPYNPANTPWALPGVVEFENFDIGGQGVAYSDSTLLNQGGAYRASERVDVSADANASNGFSVGWTTPDEWMEYTVNVASSEVYTVGARVAAKGAGGQFRMTFSGPTPAALLFDVPDTGAWNNYRDVEPRATMLSAGVYTVRVEMVQSGSGGNIAALDQFSVRMPPPQKPYNRETPWPLPGVVQFEDFDEGAPGLGYSDATPANEGRAYRPDEPVDISADANASNGYSVGWTSVGEWLEYTVNVQTAGIYNVVARVAGVGTGGKFMMIFPLGPSEEIQVPNTGAWNRYQEVSVAEGVSFPAGEHKIFVEMRQAGSSGYVGAFDCFTIRPPPSQNPYNRETPWPLPGVVQFEDFDEGAPGLGYSDTTPANEGRAYRPDEPVDISADANASNGYSVGWTSVGEWLEYTVNVQTTGIYNVVARVAGVGTGGKFMMIFPLGVSEEIPVPNTGAWNRYQEVSVAEGMYFPAGEHKIRVEMRQAGSSGHVGSFDCFTIRPPPSHPSLWPLPLPGVVQFEDFGGPGMGYSDMTPTNEGRAYRPDESVDISADANASNGYSVGWTSSGEWLEYAVNIQTAGIYNIFARVAAVGTGGKFKMSFPLGVSEEISVPNTGAWNRYQEVPVVTDKFFPSGEHKIRVTMFRAGSSGYVGAFDCFRVVAQEPWGGTAVRLPGVLEAENFDLGGQGVAYVDQTAANEGGVHRPTESVGIAQCHNTISGYSVGWTVAGEWLEYTVDVATPDFYEVTVRLAAVGAGGQFKLVSGVNESSVLSVPNTGGWNVYTSVKTSLYLDGGIQRIRLSMLKAGTGGHVAAFDRMTFALLPSRAATKAFSTVSPVDVRTSEETTRPGMGWLALDEDATTVWQGTEGAASWWLTAAFAEEQEVNSLELDADAESADRLQVLYSTDAEEWIELALPMEDGPIWLNYLWLLFTDDGGVPPSIREIHLR